VSVSRWRIGFIAGAALAAVPVLAAAAPRAVPVVIRNMAFGSAPQGLRVGDTVEWVNDDIFLHSATSPAGGFDVTLKPGAHVRMTLARAGTFAFTCRYHPGMRGRLTVAAAAPAKASGARPK
jgi:plastocyanin